ncbi:uncharacterized protein BX663DRAFT_563650 [Cokeromyces recurvatus]|uniref:uncharacterized protein n=1 Tax=Cokeromyces recurvatus TaxID=90255 RepID=UPI00221F56DA|nr:uncharacterized protein BX663DRAFT_563650 [Cokeromyces recurvatus]KAI7899698.1 hypothetical protein BX663DRAFT_563650 [Cokeromyces recurvatus]
MKSRKNKGNTTLPSEEDSIHRNAFSFLKNRFFSSSNNNNNNNNNNNSNNNNNTNNNTIQQTEKINGPRPSISSIRSAVIKPWSIETKNEFTEDKPLSRSLDDNSLMEFTSKVRPMSMMGMDSLSTELPATIQIAKPKVDSVNVEKRTSLIIVKEGYLFKKTDFRPFHKQNDRGWKLYRVVLRGHKLYLYKLTSESSLRSLSPSYKSTSHHSLSNTTMKLVKSDFDREAQQLLFLSNSKGCVFMELNPVTMLAKQEVYLVLMHDTLYICIRPDIGQLWKIEKKVPIQDLKIEINDTITPISPASFSSIQSDYSNGLFFNLIHRPSTFLGMYSTQYRELGQAWINVFHQLEEDQINMCDATQDNLTCRNHRSDEIQGGSLHALVRQLFEGNHEYLNVFLLTYSLFTSGSHVLNEIKSILEEGEPSFQSRLLEIFTVWCERYALDVMGDVATVMMELLDKYSNTNQVKELVLKTVAENTKKTCVQAIVPTMTTAKPLSLEDHDDDDDDDEIQNTNEVENINTCQLDNKRRDSSINLSNLLITGLTRDIFLQMDPASFAQQIYLFHFSKYKQFQQDLLNPISYLPRPQTSAQMLNSLLFTTTSPHFLTRLIRNQILIDSQDDAVIRSQLLEHWIHIGLELIKLGDMTGWCAVAIGVCSVGIVRLRESWKCVNRELVNHVQTDWVRLLADYGLFTLDVWNESWGEPPMLIQFCKVLDIHDVFAIYELSPTLLNLEIPQNPLPFFGTIRQAVDRFRKHTTKKLETPTAVNFLQCQYIYEMITTSLNEWINDHHPQVLSDNSTPLISPLQSFFEYSVTEFMSVPHSYKYLQECSLACEPKVFGQIFNCTTFNRRSQIQQATSPSELATPPSMSCLVFPNILNSFSLLTNEPIIKKRSNTSTNQGYSTTQQSFKKTHPHKNNSIRSLRSLLEDDRNNNNNNSSSSSITTTTTTTATTATATATKKQTGITTQSNSSASLVNTSDTDALISNYRKAFCRRTYSFPPGSSSMNESSSSVQTISTKATTTTTTTDLLESDGNRTWLGSLLSNRSHRTYSTRTLIEAHRKSRAVQYDMDGDIVLFVHDLVFKVSAILKNESALILSKVKEPNLDFLKEKGDYEGTNDEDVLLVTIKSGSLEQLVDILVFGLSNYESSLREQWQMSLLSEGLQQRKLKRVIMDEKEYVQTFFMTYRIYCSSNELLNMFRKRFLGTKQRCKSTLKRTSSISLLETYFTPMDTKTDDILMYDWKKVAKIQLRVLNLLLYWVQMYPYDFADDIEVTHYISQFLRQARRALEEWSVPLAKCHDEDIKPEHAEALKTAAMIKQRIIDIREQFVNKSLDPCYDMKAVHFDPEVIRTVESVYSQLNQTKDRYHITLQLATNKSMPLSISTQTHNDIDTTTKSPLDQFSSDTLLDQVNHAVHQLFSTITLQEWIQTFGILEAQLEDIHAWLPPRKPSRTSRLNAALAPVLFAPTSFLSSHHVLLEDVVVSDIFTAIESAKRSLVAPSAYTDDDLLLAFPSSIQYLYYLHFIIRSWVISEIIATHIDSKTRFSRIEKFLQMIMSSRLMSQRMTVSTDSHVGRMPGFVEYAIATALVSPEVRLFTKAWSDIAVHYGHANLDTLENLLSQIQLMKNVVSTTVTTTNNNNNNSTTVVPSLGWIFERIIELCTHSPDAPAENRQMIHFDKRRSLYQFMQFIMNIQQDLNEQPAEAKGLSMSFLISPNKSTKSWKDLKEFAIRENKRSVNSLVVRTTSSKGSIRHIVFSKLVTEQLEKLKRDFKERDRMDREWLTLQQKLQKKQLEQARLVEKQDRKTSHNNKSLPTSQPQHHHHHNGVMPRLNSFLRGLRPQSMVGTHSIVDRDATTKASTVINLIHATTSVASTYTKRDFVFRVVTEEGGQYLFQAVHREDMHDWLQEINNASREAAAKRQSVLAAESMEHDNHEAFLMDNNNNNNNRNQPASRTSVYGVKLETLMHDNMIPIVVEKCIREIERRGLEEVGIYRVAGTGSVVSALKAEFNKDATKVDLSQPKWMDINVIADAFKQFLRELPEPLLTYTYYNEFIMASASEDHDERIYLLKKVLKKLPHCNYVLLKRIIEHFVIVTDFEATNHMYATNLAIVFGPTLLQPAPGPASFATTMSNLGHHQNIVKYFILNYHYLFDIESEEVYLSTNNSKPEEQVHNEV